MSYLWESERLRCEARRLTGVSDEGCGVVERGSCSFAAKRGEASEETEREASADHSPAVAGLVE